MKEKNQNPKLCALSDEELIQATGGSIRGGFVGSGCNSSAGNADAGYVACSTLKSERECVQQIHCTWVNYGNGYTCEHK